MRNQSGKCLLVALFAFPWHLSAQPQAFSNHEELLREARSQSLVILSNAIDRASRLKEPGIGYASIAETCIIGREPKVALRLISEMSAKLKNFEDGRPGYSSATVEAFSTFAVCSAPLSKEERDIHLRRAIWCLDRHTKNGMKLLTIMDDFNLFRAILSPNAKGAALKPSGLLLRLDPELYIEQNKGNDPAITRRILLSEAENLHRLVLWGENQGTRRILEYMIENGDRSSEVLSLYKFYDAQHAPSLPRYDEPPRVIMREGIELSEKRKRDNLRKLILVFDKGDPQLRVWIITRMLEYDYETAHRHISRLKEFSSRDEAIAAVVSRAAYECDHGLLTKMLEEIRADNLYVSTACVLAKNMLTRRYYLYGVRDVGKHVDDYVDVITKAEQAGTGQPATRPESKSKGGDKPQPEAE